MEEMPVVDKGKGKAPEDDTEDDDSSDEDLVVEDDDASDEDDLDEIDPQNIIPGKRRTRGKEIDFSKDAEAMDDEEEDDGNYSGSEKGEGDDAMDTGK
ncbi:hypothetical protein BDZ91DRAFT_722498 [Kalaharituber pfeilii]|nr:hypothetical protein BDZ91DRAFT_722498 [Kalaharituber pfeilii]